MDNLKIKLPPHISKTIEILNSNGHKAHGQNDGNGAGKYLIIIQIRKNAQQRNQYHSAAGTEKPVHSSGAKSGQGNFT